jgi:hypothetical protein
MSMYQWLLALHSVLRWLVLLLGLIAVFRAFGGRGRSWTPADDRAGKLYGISLDVQLLIGLILYGLLSPVTRAAFSDMGSAMREPVLRFFAVEHIALMVLAVALVHIGTKRIRRATTDAAKFRTAAIFYTFSLLFVLLSIPWPFRTAGRPLFPSF